MLRRILCLGGLVAIAAFGATVATAQAEPHWYKNNVVLPEEAGITNSEGTPVLGWSKLTLVDHFTSTIVCNNAFGAQVYNPTGGGPGESKIESYTAWNCTEETCEAAFKSKMELIPEGLSKFGFWEAKLFQPEAGVIRLKMGNPTPESPTQIEFTTFCPPTGSGEYKFKWRGEWTPKVKNGTALSAPSKIEFGAGSGELEFDGEKKGPNPDASGSLKVMGYAGNEIISVKNP